MVYIAAMDNQEYPPFVTFNNATNTINFNPNSPTYSGLTYYFEVVLKEVNSDIMMNIAYMTINMNGAVYVP
jgi:hypothetical protein